MDRACPTISKFLALRRPPALLRLGAPAGMRCGSNSARDFNTPATAEAATLSLPVVDGEPVACMQIPTTLPTLDELLCIEPGLTPDKAMDRILQLSRAIPGDHVFTLRAETRRHKISRCF